MIGFQADRSGKRDMTDIVLSHKRDTYDQYKNLK